MRTRLHSLRRWTPLLAALVLAGCASAPAVTDKDLPQTPSAFSEGSGLWTAAAPAEAQARGDWWKAFGDAQLDALIERADGGSTSIQIAAARLAQARAVLGATDANRAPQLGLSAGGTREAQRGLGVAPNTVLNAGAQLSYELDLFGRLAKASDAAALDARSREALLHSTRLLVQAQVAQSYFALRALDAERTLVRGTVDAYRDTLRLTERRHAAGDVAELDLVRVRSEADANTAPSPSIMKRLARGEWQSPLVQVMVIQHYAKSELGEDWATLPLTEFESLMAIDLGSERDVG